MAHCTSHQAWVETLNKEQTMEQSRLGAGGLPDEHHERCRLVNPYVGDSPFFARGLSHMFYNSSAKTRLLLAPGSEEPLTSRRHHAHILATRNNDPERVPMLLPAAEPEGGSEPPTEPGGEHQRGSVTFREPPSFASTLGAGENSTFSSSLSSGAWAAQPNSARGLRPLGAALRPTAMRISPARRGAGSLRSSSLLGPRAARDFRATSQGFGASLHPRESPRRTAVYGKMVMPVG